MAETGTESTPSARGLNTHLVKGFAWTAGAKWLSQIVSWPAVLITARKLSPADFGITEMAGFYFVVTNVMSEFGIGSAIVWLRELDAGVIAQMNSVALLSGFIAFAASVGFAPLIAAFFRTPELHRLVIVTSFSFILTSAEAIPLSLLQREMNYRRISLAESAQAVVTAVVSVSCAFAGFAYWSLIAGNLAGRTANVALTFAWCPVRYAMPKWRDVGAPLRFGVQIAMTRVSSVVMLMSDGMVVGRVLGETPLGFYRLAINLASVPAEKIGALIMRVTGPFFARYQNDQALLREYYLIFTEAISLTLFPLIFGLAIVAPDAVALLLGAKWAASATPLRWLAVFLALRSLTYLTNQVLLTLRYTAFVTHMSFRNVFLMPIAFWVAAHWGLAPVAAAWLAMSPITVLPTLQKILPAVGCTAGTYLNSLAPALFGSATMAVTVVTFRALAAAHWPLIGRICAEVAVGGMAYCGIVLGFYRPRVIRYVNFLRQMLQRRSAASVTA